MLEGRLVVVTGASGALGSAAMERLTASGATAVGVARKASDNNVAADLTDAASALAAMEFIVEKHGRIDALLNVAGGFDMGPADDLALWDRMWKMNFVTAHNATMAALPAMKKQGSGAVVFVAGRVEPAGAQMGAYTAAKSAVMRLTESLSAEVKDAGIRVNCVMPSIIDTPANRSAMPDAEFDRWVEPAAIADTMLFLCGDGARAIHGATIPVFGRV